MDGKLPGNMKDGDMMKQAQHIWAMLDDMANSDPASYRKFIDKQMKDGKEAMKPPTSHMCIQTTIQNKSSERERLFINVFEWTRMPGPKDDDSPIPVMGGPVYDGKDEHGSYKCVSVAFNPEVLKEFGLGSKLVEERRMLINLAIDYLQDQHHLQISRSYALLKSDTTCKGSEKKASETLVKKYPKKDDEFQKQLSDLEKTFGPVTDGCKDSLLDKLSNITVPEESENSDPVPSSEPSQSQLRLPGQKDQSEKVLVEEMHAKHERLSEPKYEISESSNDYSTRTIIVRVYLHGVESVSECELDISEDDVKLFVPEKYQLQINLERRVLESESSAKFSKKSSTLTLKLPVQPGGS